MNIIYGLMSFGALFLTLPTAFAQPIQGTSFSHLNWEVYCSNTGTCRAAGYQDDNHQDYPASILLTRKAGAQQALQVDFALSNNDQAFDQNKLKNIHFYINDKDYGVVSIDGSEAPLIGTLNIKQRNGLQQQAKQNAKIVFKNAHYTWQISDAGMTAALLKMDDFQKRIGTVGALVKRGKASESKVLTAQPKLMIRKVKTAEKPYLTLQPQSKPYANLHKILMAAKPSMKDSGDFCEGIYTEKGAQSQAIELYSLSNHKVLATTTCWRGAYNEGYGAWVIDRSLKGKATFVTESASDFGNGEIGSAHKGRGIGDCWAMSVWIWNGQVFVQSLDRWSGMCKGIAAGGVWNLDRIESVVR